MFAMITQAPGAVRALEGLKELVDANVEWASAAEDAVFRQFALRIQSDLRDGVASVLTRDFAGVMDVSRDLMELSVLIYDFSEEPQRLTKWLKTDEGARSRDFGYNKLLGKHALGREMTEEQVSRFRGEYAIHSATLHPAPPAQNARELTREQELEMPLFPWVVTSTAELSRHVKMTSMDLSRWLDRSRVSSAAIENRKVDIEAVDAWMKEVNMLQAGVAKDVHAAMKAADPRSKKQPLAAPSNAET